MLYASLGNWNVILVATILWTGAFAVECPNACRCTIFYEFVTLSCTEVSILYNITLYEHRNILIECFNLKSNNEAIDYCSISTILNKILLKADLENLPELVFRSVSQNRTDIVISKDAFKSVQNLNILSILYNSIVTFESDFLRNTPNITVLKLVNSGVSRVDNYFTYLSKLTYLRLSQNKISSIPNKPFENLSLLTHLYLDGNIISDLSKYAFSGLRMLRTLDLSRNQIRELTEDYFEELISLHHIYLRFNRLKNIDPHIFGKNPLVIVELDNNSEVILPDYLLANLKLLVSVDLALNNLEEMPENIFRKCENLSYLSLSKNRLASLPETLFGDSYILEILDLSGNKFKSLPDNLFVSTPMLKALNLSNNHLSVINKYLFRFLYSLSELDLHNNRIYLIELDAFRWLPLVYLDLSYNKWNPSSANNFLTYCRSLQQLILSHNEIRIFPYLPAFKNVKIMDLSYNQIEYFEVKNVIDPLWSPTEYDLSNNRIRNITFCLDKPIGPKNFSGSKIVLKVAKNPIQCDCSIYDLVRYNNGEMEDVFDILDIDQNNLFCPGRQNGIPITALRPSDFDCPALQDCPSMCECWYTPCNKALVIDCAFKNLSTYPEIYVEELSHQHIILNLSGNFLSKGPFIQESYSNVISLNLSSNRINGIDWIPPQIKELDLSHNNLENLNRAFIRRLKNSINLQWLGLRNNSWTCDCEATDFRDYLIENYYMLYDITFMGGIAASFLVYTRLITEHHLKVEVVTSVASLNKLANDNYTNTCIKKIRVKLDEVYCENMDSPLVKINDLCKEIPYLVVLLPAFLTIFLCLAVTIALYYRYQTEIKIYLYSKNMCLWFVTEEEMDKDKIFDVFISYSHQDEDFVVGQLLPQLEQGENPFKVCIHIRDWIPGELIVHQIIKSVQDSRRTLIVLSNNFLESVWGKMEFRAAHTETLIAGRARVIVLLYGDIDENKLNDELRSYFKTNTYIKWGEKYFWNKLKYALPHLKNNLILMEENVGIHGSMVSNEN